MAGGPRLTMVIIKKGRVPGAFPFSHSSSGCERDFVWGDTRGSAESPFLMKNLGIRVVRIEAKNHRVFVQPHTDSVLQRVGVQAAIGAQHHFLATIGLVDRKIEIENEPGGVRVESSRSVGLMQFV